MKRFQSQVATLWVALGRVNNSITIAKKGTSYDNFESNLRKSLKDIHFCCPTLEHCLRNGQKIVTPSQYFSHFVEVKISFHTWRGLSIWHSFDFGLNRFSPKIKSTINDGLLHIMPDIYRNPIKALQEVFKNQDCKKTFIFIAKDGGLEMSSLETNIPDHDFTSAKDKVALRNWLESSNMKQHLVLCVPPEPYAYQNSYNCFVSGMEFPSMIYLVSSCRRCHSDYFNPSPSVITRAKASLVIARYYEELGKGQCYRCDANDRRR